MNFGIYRIYIIFLNIYIHDTRDDSCCFLCVEISYGRLARTREGVKGDRFGPEESDEYLTKNGLDNATKSVLDVRFNTWFACAGAIYLEGARRCRARRGSAFFKLLQASELEDIAEPC